MKNQPKQPAVVEGAFDVLVPEIDAKKNVIEAQIQLHCINFKHLENQALIEAVRCGAKLVELKPLITHGNFEDYVNETFAINRQRAAQWMRLSVDYAGLIDPNANASANLPSYSVALELLDARTDTPPVKEAKLNLKTSILVDGEKYTVAQVKALKQQAKDAELATEQAVAQAKDEFESHIDTVIAERMKFESTPFIAQAAQLQDEINQKDQDIELLRKDITELHKQISNESKEKAEELEKNLAFLEEQASERKKQIANLNAELFLVEDKKKQNSRFNDGTVLISSKLITAIDKQLDDLNGLRVAYPDSEINADNVTVMYMIASRLQKAVFTLYEMAGANSVAPIK